MWFKKLRQGRQRKLEIIEEIIKIEGKIVRAKRLLRESRNINYYEVRGSILTHEENLYKLKVELFLGRK